MNSPAMVSSRPPTSARLHRQRAVTIMELLLVIAIISTLAGVAMPAVSGLMRGQNMTRNVFSIRGALEEARVTAMSQNTFVWLGLCEKTVDGVPSLVITALSSRSGQSTDLQAGNTRVVIKPTTLRNITIDADGVAGLPGVDRQNSTALNQSQYAFEVKLPGQSVASTFKAVEFKPNGEVGLCTGALRYVLIGLSSGPNQEVAGIQLARLNGHAEVFRQ